MLMFGCLLPIVLAKSSEVPQNSNSLPFRFSCSLAEHPLFQIPRLVELMSSIASQTPDKVTCVATKGNSGSCNWSGRIHQERFAEITSHIEETGLLILIKDAQSDPEYQLFLSHIVNELGKLTGQNPTQQNTWLDAYFSISPLNSTTKHPLNHELNFLFQIHEAKSSLVQENPSIFISLVSVPREIHKANLHLFSLSPSSG